MLDLVSTPKGRIVAAALRLAEAKPWREVTLLDIARGAGLTLTELRAQVGSKTDILADLTRIVDDELMTRMSLRNAADSSTRDRLFDVVMTRFDLLQPHKPALKSILADLAEREAKPTKDKTNFFAKNVIEYMGQTTEMKPDPHREAAFRVLKSADVPSVLIELAYVSNRQDAENLKSVEWREKVSTSIANAVARYFNFAGLPL